jgi:hypothetical protein
LFGSYPSGCGPVVVVGTVVAVALGVAVTTHGVAVAAGIVAVVVGVGVHVAAGPPVTVRVAVAVVPPACAVSMKAVWSGVSGGVCTPSTTVWGDSVSTHDQPSVVAVHPLGWIVVVSGGGTRIMSVPLPCVLVTVTSVVALGAVVVGSRVIVRAVVA